MLFILGGNDMFNKITAYFSRFEIALWLSSVLLVVTAFFAFDRTNYLSLIASLIGVTSLILNAKGNPIGQVLMVTFSLLYGIISYSFSYYGEMITYIGMTMPMAVIALVSWLKNPFNGKKSEVKVGSISKTETVFMLFLTASVTVLFYFILKHFHTANLIPSDLCVKLVKVLVDLALVHDLLQEIGPLFFDVVQIVANVVGVEHITLRFARLWVAVAYRLRVGIDFPNRSAVLCLFALE